MILWHLKKKTKTWREGYFQCRAGFTPSKESSWKRSAENERSVLCAGVRWKFECSKCEKSLLGPSPPLKSVLCLQQAQCSGSGQGLFAQLHCPLSYWGLISGAVPVSAAAAAMPITGSHLREMSSLLLMWQPLPRGLQQPKTRIFWIILIDSLVGCTNLSHTSLHHHVWVL